MNWGSGVRMYRSLVKVDAPVPYRLLALDVDGTLLDARHQLPPRVARAVVAACASGLTVTLATGKLLRSIQPLIEALGLNGPQICLNGAAIMKEVSEPPLHYAPLTNDDRRAVIETVRRLAPETLISQFALDDIIVDREDPSLSVFEEFGEQRPEIVSDLLTVESPPAAKILVVGSPDRVAALHKQIAPILGARLYITTTMPIFLEFFRFEANKGDALRRLRESLGIAREDVIAIGDGENDAPLLREAGLPVAMSNGATATRAAAQIIAPSNDEEGVAVVLERLLRNF
jgi:Cof subfamily protein (haloacid dehalogenase superfamily)